MSVAAAASAFRHDQHIALCRIDVSLTLLFTASSVTEALWPVTHLTCLCKACLLAADVKYCLCVQGLEKLVWFWQEEVIAHVNSMVANQLTGGSANPLRSTKYNLLSG